MIYDTTGQSLSQVFTCRGDISESAYDIDGVRVFQEITGVKVMIYNVGGWYIGSGTNVPAEKSDVYYALQRDMIVNNDPDVLVLTEYWEYLSPSVSAYGMLQELFPYIHQTGTSSTYMGRCIASKYPISNYQEHTYTGSAPRYYDSCTVTINDVPVTFVITHLSTQQTQRDDEIPELIAFLDTKETFIACGDYNTDIAPETANTDSQAYIDNVKPFVDAGFHTANFNGLGFFLTYMDRVTNAPLYLDNAYTSSDVNVLGAYVDRTKLIDGFDDPIDHMPFITYLQIPSSALS